jgi:hypothetical protein
LISIAKSSLQSCLKELHAARYEILSTALKISLTQDLAAIGRLAEGMTLIDETIRLVEANGDACCMPELLRVKGSVLLSMPRPRADEAETCFMQSPSSAAVRARAPGNCARRPISQRYGPATDGVSTRARPCSWCSSNSWRARIPPI